MMNTRFVHGDISIEVQRGWQDASKIAFAEEPDPSIARDLARRALASGAPIPAGLPMRSRPRSNFVISTRPYGSELPPGEYCEKELTAMLRSFAHGRLGSVGTAVLGGAPAVLQDVEFEFEDTTLKQLHALAVLDGRVVHFVGTSTVGGYGKARDKFLQTMASIRIEKQ